MNVRSHKPKSAIQDRSAVDRYRFRRVLIIHEAIFQFFSETEVKITCRQVVFSYLATLLFRHVALCTDHAIFSFHSPLRASFQVRLNGTKNKPCFQVFREGTHRVQIQLCVTFGIQCLTLKTKPESMVDGKHMPDCGVIGNERNK